MVLTEDIILEGSITPETFANYLYTHCLKDKVKQHMDKNWSIPETLLKTFALSQGENVSFPPAKFNKFNGSTNPTYTKFVFNVLNFFKNKKIDISEDAIKRAIDYYGRITYGSSAKAFGYASVVSEGVNYFNY